MRKLIFMTLTTLLFAVPSFPQDSGGASKCPLVGESHTFTAMWFTPKNHLYSTSISVSPAGVCRNKPTGIFTAPEKRCFPISKVKSVGIRPGVASDDVIVESSGGGEPLIGDGMSSSDAKQITDLVLRYQHEEAECRMMDGAR